MAIKLSECSPSLHAAIMAQLEKEGRTLPQTIVRYALAYRIFKDWRVGPETENLKLVTKQALKLQTASGRAAAETLAGNPPAVVVKITRTTEPLKRTEI